MSSAAQLGLAAKELLDSGKIEPARVQAGDAMAVLKEAGSTVEGVFTVVSTYTAASIAAGVIEEALGTVEEMLGFFKKSDNVVGEASTLLASAELSLAQGAEEDGSGYCVKALKAANKELEKVRTSGNKKAEVELLEVVTKTHDVMEEPYGALESAKLAKDLYQAMGDFLGVGNMLLAIAVQERKQGYVQEATKTAEQAEKAFRSAKSKTGKEKALRMISGLFVERGQPEKAPTRTDALKCLSSLSKATEMRKVEDCKELETELNSYGEVLGDSDLAEVLQPLFAKDPEAIEFLEKELGWDFGAKPGGGGKGNSVRFYPQKSFYLMNVMGGMNFGPQFRVVNPHRVDKEFAVSVSQLPETEAWQMELGFRPGYMDSILQVQGAFGFP